MQINYEKETTDVISRLEQAGYYTGTIAAHKRCYDGLQAYLAVINLTFTMETALEWLESRKGGWSYATYCQYRGALYRLERYITDGSIARTTCRSIDEFACHDSALKLPKPLYELYCEIRSLFSERFCESSVHNYTQGCKDFLLFMAAQGYSSATELEIDPIIEYARKLYGEKNRLRGQKTGWLAGIVNLLNYITERGDIPHCYTFALPRNTATLQLLPLKTEYPGTAFQPSKKLEPLAKRFLSSLNEQRYNDSSKQLYGHDLTNYFLFIEVNHHEYSPESVELWLNHSPKNSLWERRRHTLTLFADFLSTGTTDKKSCYTWQSVQINSLPDWSRSIILGFIAERRREGLARTTLTMCRSAGYRFFRFLDSKGVGEPQAITPELVKEFHNTEKHSTPESKNAYGIKVRQLLLYMAEQKLVPRNIYLAISTQCAPRRRIVSVMSAEMESAVFDYRKNALTPLELRNAAIVMLGLRMGLRASDIVNLKIDDFNWEKRTVSFMQRKTRKAITLPVPIDTGNSVYRYIAEGRPKSSSKGNGYVFVRHLAPFAGMKTIQACRSALKSILCAYGLKLSPGEGFHITRKTFATRLLTSKNSIDDISNALGHALPETAEVYLARDEEGMRLCPLSFESAGMV